MKKLFVISVFCLLLIGCTSSTEKEEKAIETGDPFLTPYFEIVDALIKNDFKAVQKSGARLNSAEHDDGVTLALTRLGRMISEAPSDYQQRMVLYQMGIVIPLYIEQHVLNDFPIYKFSCNNVLDGKEGVWFSKEIKSGNPFAQENKDACATLVETIKPVTK